MNESNSQFGNAFIMKSLLGAAWPAFLPLPKPFGNGDPGHQGASSSGAPEGDSNRFQKLLDFLKVFFRQLNPR